MIDVSALSYSDAMIFCEDYLSDSPIYNVTHEEFHQIANTYGMDISSFQPNCKRFKI